MAMVYIKSLSSDMILRGSLIVLVCLLMVACGASPTVENAPSVYQALAQNDALSLSFLPKLKRDSKGKSLPYQPKTNPYLKKSQPALSPMSVTMFIEAKKAYESSSFDQAERLLLRLTEMEQSLSGPWVLLGDIAFKKQRFELAEQHYSKAIALNSYNVNAYLRLAHIKRMQGEFSTARNTYVDALGIWPDFPEAHLNLGILYDLYLNQPVNAQRHIEAYQFLTHNMNQTVSVWLDELTQRTGQPILLKHPVEETVIKALP